MVRFCTYVRRDLSCFSSGLRPPVHSKWGLEAVGSTPCLRKIGSKKERETDGSKATVDAGELELNYDFKPPTIL